MQIGEGVIEQQREEMVELIPHINIKVMRKTKLSLGISLILVLSVFILSCKEVKDFGADNENEQLQFYTGNSDANESAEHKKEEFKGGPVDFTETAKKVLDAVVHIRSTQTAKR